MASKPLLYIYRPATVRYARSCYSAVYYSNVGGDVECWIGLYKSVAEVSDASSYWLDGNPSTYRNWLVGEPDTVDQCIRIVNGEFRDIRCDWSYRYVCKGMYFCLKLFFVDVLFGSH